MLNRMVHALPFGSKRLNVFQYMIQKEIQKYVLKVVLRYSCSVIRISKVDLDLQ
jgi:hypothetical protein